MMIRKVFTVTIYFVALLLFGCEDTSHNQTSSEENTASNGINSTQREEVMDSVAIKCELTIREENDEHIYADLTFTNESKVSVSLLKWKLLLGGELTFSAFRVSLDDNEVRYEGKMIKRGPATDDDYYILSPMDSVDVSVLLSDYYDFTRKGHYTVLYYSYHPVKGSDELITVESNMVEFKRE